MAVKSSGGGGLPLYQIIDFAPGICIAGKNFWYIKIHDDDEIECDAISITDLRYLIEHTKSFTKFIINIVVILSIHYFPYSLYLLYLSDISS